MTKQNGFTLLEIMIALVIFSIGLLGLAGLQGVSMQNNQIAYTRTIATQLAYDMADRIRNNPLGTYTTAAIPGSAPASCITSSSNCSSAAMAQYDLWEWSQTVKDKNSNLVSPEMFITADGAGGFTISIGWDENRQGLSSGYDCSVTPPTPPGVECVTLTINL